MPSDDTEYGWGCRSGESVWHFVHAPHSDNTYVPDHGTSACGIDMSRANGDKLDYTAHPRVGTRCEECESKRCGIWVDWLDEPEVSP
jgi:hypothetical protein